MVKVGILIKQKRLKMKDNFSNLLKNISVQGEEGKPKVIFWQGKEAPTLEESQSIVGGLIECVANTYHKIKDADVIVNEEGLVYGLELNESANCICKIPLVGNVLVLKGEQRLK